MKKAFFILIGIVFGGTVSAQFVQGIGIMGGVTYANQKWKFPVQDSTVNKKYVLGFNGCIFGEFFANPYVRWRTEFQFNQKGSKEEITTTAGETQKLKNKLNYICWNNFLVVRYEFFSVIPYILGGPRVEYRLSEKVQSPVFVETHRPLHFSWSVGAGVEWVVYGKFKPMVELHYNPDFDEAYKTDLLQGKNKAFELRVGLKYQFVKKTDCPPVYL